MPWEGVIEMVKMEWKSSSRQSEMRGFGAERAQTAMLSHQFICIGSFFTMFNLHLWQDAQSPAQMASSIPRLNICNTKTPEIKSNGELDADQRHERTETPCCSLVQHDGETSSRNRDISWVASCRPMVWTKHIFREKVLFQRLRMAAFLRLRSQPVIDHCKQLLNPLSIKKSHASATSCCLIQDSFVSCWRSMFRTERQITAIRVPLRCATNL